MSTTAQIEANRQNAQASTGPATSEGKSATARNALKHGLFTTANCVQPNEREEYNYLYTALWNRLAPADPAEELHATEIIRTTWRLRRCVMVEESLADQAARSHLARDPMEHPELLKTQAAVDRARARSYSILHRSSAELRRLQTERARRLQTQPGPAPARVNGFEFSTSHPAPAAPAPIAPVAKQTQSASASTPRNAPCPCGSKVKYKRCCGHNAPPVLHLAA